MLPLFQTAGISPPFYIVRDDSLVLLPAKVRQIKVIRKSIVLFVVISLFLAGRKIGTRGGRNDISTVIRTAAAERCLIISDTIDKTRVGKTINVGIISL